MMSYSWFKSMHGPHLEGVVFPGDLAYDTSDRKLTAYSMGDFLEHNLKPDRPNIYVCGGWKELEQKMAKNRDDTQAFKAVPGFRTVPAGICERVVTDDGWAAAHPTHVIGDNGVLHMDEFMTRKHLKSLYTEALVQRFELSPLQKGINASHELDKYDDRTWERNIHTHTQQALQRLSHWLVMWAQVPDQR